MLLKKIALMLLLGACIPGNAHPLPKDTVLKRWDASWICPQNCRPHDYGVYCFRKTFSLPGRPGALVIHVSADNRYKLYVNDSMVSLGPARGDLFHWQYESLDIAPYLHEGKNVIAAVVWNFGEYRPEHQISFRTGFILQAEGSDATEINTGSTWKAMKDSSYEPLQPDLVYCYYVAGPGERVDFNRSPEGWQDPAYDDSRWADAVPIVNGLPKGVLQSDLSWMLVPRDIPQVELTYQRLRRTRLDPGNIVPAGFPANPASFTIPAHQRVQILLDNSVLTNAYPVLQFSGGKEARIRIGYAESLYLREPGDDWKAQEQKGNRDSVAGKRFVGVEDEIISAGRDHQVFTSLAWRTYRYVQLEIETSDDPLTINDFYGIFTGYPFSLHASFNSGNDTLQKIFETGWRTARLDAVETYMDCPYYEQLQYIGDTRIQAMVSLFNSGDDRLMRQAISQLDASRLAEGITLSRYPTANAQEIPPFSLWWIGMLHDYYMYRNDPAFVKQFLPGERQVLQFFSRYQGTDGSLYNAPYWEFTDWCEGKGWNSGEAPIGADGCSSVLDLQLLWAYQVASVLEDRLGMKAFAHEYAERAALLAATIRKKYWDPGKDLFADTDEKKYFSQHANALAILTGLVQGAASRDLSLKIIHDTTLTQATIYFTYYVNQALARAGLGDLYLDRLQIWKADLDSGLTTWAEMSDINRSRSDCHAWGASPNIEFLRTVLGIDTDAPGFAVIRIEPHLGSLRHVSGSMPHPLGEIRVQYDYGSSGRLSARITLPPGTSGVFVWHQKKYSLKAGRTELKDL